jgi:hypothetical protein
MPALIPALILGVIALIWQLVSRVVNVLIQPLINELNLKDPQVPISPADAADMVERAIISRDDGRTTAAKSGIDNAAFDLLVLDTGEPPGLEQMLSLWNRGLLPEDKLDTMIAYSRVRLEWGEYVKLLAHQTMSSADAIEAVLKGVLPEAEGRTLYGRAGGLDDQWDTLLATAGNPIGVEQALNLWNHHLISEAEVQKVILHSRINPQFEGIAELMHFRYIPAFQIARMVSTGAITAAQATDWLLAQGYPADQVAGFVTAETSTKVAKTKTLTEAQITEAYDAGILSAADADAELQGIGYEATETAFILALYDYKRKLSMAQSAIGQVRKIFLAGRITKEQASVDLDGLQVDPTARDYYLQIWEVEATVELKSLTAGEIGNSYKAGGYSDAQALAAVEALGYTATDANLFLVYYGMAPPTGYGPPPAPAAAGG